MTAFEHTDREPLPRKTQYRTSEDNILTQGIGELREAGATFDLLPIARITMLKLHFMASERLQDKQR